MRLLVLLCGLWVCVAQAAPLQVNAAYTLTKKGQQIGTVAETFRRSDGRYQLESVTTATGIYALFAKGKIRLVSSGEASDKGLRPLHFEHHRGSDPAKLIQADFDWEKMSLTFHFDGKTETVGLESGTQDRISLLYQFMFAPPAQGDIRLHMTTGRKLNLYHYQLAGEERITTPAGRFETLHLVKQHTADEDGTEIWLAKNRHYFPVRIVIEERDGSRLEQNLTSLSFGGE